MLVIPPALLGVAVVPVAVIVRLKADADRRVVEDAGLHRQLHLPDERLGMVDWHAFAIGSRRNQPAAERGEVIGLGVCLVGPAHGHAVLLQGNKRIGGRNIDVKSIDRIKGGARFHPLAEWIIDHHLEHTLAAGMHAQRAHEIAVMKTADHHRLSLTAALAGDHQAVVDLHRDFRGHPVRPGAGTAFKDLEFVQWFAWQEAGLVDHADASDSRGDLAWVGHREPEHRERQIVIECDVQMLGQPVAALGDFCHGDLDSLAELIIDRALGPLAFHPVQLFPVEFVHGEAGVGNRPRAGAGINHFVNAAVQVVVQ